MVLILIKSPARVEKERHEAEAVCWFVFKEGLFECCPNNPGTPSMLIAARSLSSHKPTIPMITPVSGPV
jgi:hypothetical protein